MIDQMWMLTITISLFAAAALALMGLLAWIGNKLYEKLEAIVKSLSSIAGDLHSRINEHDRRITVVETKIELRSDRNCP